MADIELYQKKIIECEQEIGKGIIGQRDINADLSELYLTSQQRL